MHSATICFGGCLTVDEILSHFDQRKANAQEKYSKFVQAGLGQAIFTRSRGKATRDRLIAKAVTAHGYSQMDWQARWAFTIRQSAEFSQRVKSANLKT